MKTKGLSIAEMEREADKGHEFEILGLNGKPSGMFLTVVGRESTNFKAAAREAENAARKVEFERIKAGAPPGSQYQTVEQDIAKLIAIYAACTTAWRNVVIDEAADGSDPLPFTPDNVKRLYAYDFVRVQAEKEILALSSFTPG